MDFAIVSLLSPEEAERFLSVLSRAKFVDGKATAAGAASQVKKNLQADRDGADLSSLDNALFAALRDNREFQLFAHPKRILAPTYSRYEPGMHYGAHVDGAIMGGANPLRADLAMTLYLSAPDCYDGGELAIVSAHGEQEIKLAAGEAVVYAATSLHRVAPVTRGVRRVAVTWIQSAVRDVALRGILYDLGKATANAETAGDAGALLLLSKCYHNLLRYAAEI